MNQSFNNNLLDGARAPMVSHPNENPNELGSNSITNVAARSGQESNQFPNDYKTVFECLLKMEGERARREEERYRMEVERCSKGDERILKEEERVRKEEDRAEKLYKILTESLESSSRQADSLQKAIVDAIGLPSSQDPKAKFWNLYKTVSGEHDDEFRAKYSGDLDTSLIFAGLFSAVSSAFIIQIQPNLQQNPNDVIQALLRLLIHNINGSVFSGPDLTIPIWVGPPPGIVAAEGMLYISLFATLLVALLAVLGKQWLAYYAKVGMRGTIRERGIERQKKFDGFRRWGFEYVMMVLPILLQISLLLFGAATTVFLWSLQRAIAGVVLVISLLGIVAYVFFVLSDIFATDSPFQTPLSVGLLKIWPWIKDGSISMAKLTNDAWLLCRNPSYLRKVEPQDPESISLEKRADGAAVNVDDIHRPMPLHATAHRHRELPLLQPRATENSDEYDCLAVLWMLETSTEPNVVAAAGSIAVDLQWSFNINFIPPLIRLRDTFMGCFEGSPGLKLRESAVNQAIACGQAYHQLDLIRRSTQSEDDEASFPVEFFSRIIDGDSEGRPFNSAELNFICSCFRGRYSVIDHSSFSPSFFRWTLHILPYFFVLPDVSRPILYLSKQLSNPGVVDRSSFTNMLLCMGTLLGFPLNTYDLAVVNKSEYCGKVLKELLRYTTGCDQRAGFCPTVFQFLDVIGIILKNMDRPPDLGDIRYKECILGLCKVLPMDRFKTEAAFAAIRLVSIIQKGRWDVFNLTHASESSSDEDEEWIREVSECVYRKLDIVDADSEWDDRVVQFIEDHLQVLIQVPHFGQYKPTHQFFRILSNSMSPGGDKIKHLRRLAFSVLCLACRHWFDDEDLRPVIQQLNIFSRLGLVVDSDLEHYGPSYMQIVAKLTGMHVWVPVIRYDIYRWVVLYQQCTLFPKYGSLKQNAILAFKTAAAVDGEELEGAETGNTSALALTAMENVWRNFDFSARIAMESVFPLVKRTWTVLCFDWIHGISIKAAGEPFVVRLESAIQDARNKVLEIGIQGSRTGMEQEEIEVAEEIARELTEIEEHLRSPTNDNRDEYRNICKRLDQLHESVLALLTRPRSYLGIT